MSTLFLALALTSVAVVIVSSIAVTAYVSERGVKINYFLWRIMIFKYFNQYVAMTKKETGKPGIWYYTLTVAMVLTFVFLALGIALK